MRATALLFLLALSCAALHAETLLSADFNTGEDGFTYCDDPFLGTDQPDFASGERVESGGYGNTGALRVVLSSPGSGQTVGASGGWCHAMQLAQATDGVRLSFRYKLDIHRRHVYDEYSRIYVSVDGKLRGRGAKDYVDHLGGAALDDDASHPFFPTTDWQQVELEIGPLDAGLHAWTIGAYNNRTAQADTATTLLVDDVRITGSNPALGASGARILVDRVDFPAYKSAIEQVASYGARLSMSTSFFNAQHWLADELAGYGYDVEYHTAVYNNQPVSNLYVTKVGRTEPDKMYLVTAHFDGRGGGGAADDDGSGVALLVEMARVLASKDIETERSIRLAFWDAEEWGSYGAAAYVADRAPLQGQEDPPGSGQYPEPVWLGMIQHDMLLYDHGANAPTSDQSAFADMDVEWDYTAAAAGQSRTLALAWHHWAGQFASDYPSSPYDQSQWTDDRPFRNRTASISVRENRRGDFREWRNPNWHQPTDRYATYSDADFRLGFNALQATLGTVATLAGAFPTTDVIFRDGFDDDMQRKPMRD